MTNSAQQAYRSSKVNWQLHLLLSTMVHIQIKEGVLFLSWWSFRFSALILFSNKQANDISNLDILRDHFIDT